MKLFRGASLLLGLVLWNSAFSVEGEEVSPRSSPVNVLSLAASAFNALPDHAPVEFFGRILNKRQFLLEMEGRWKAAQDRRPVNPNFRGAQDPGFQALKSSFLAGQRKRIDDNNRMVWSKVLAGAPGTAGVSPSLSPDACRNPKVTSISVVPPVLTGGDFIVNGCGFGPKAGELRLVGDFPPTGFVKLRILRPWSDDVLLARVPPVSGARDQSASRIQVVTLDGRVSDPVPLAFEATIDVVQLAQGDLSIACAVSNAYDRCPDIPETCVGWSTFAGMHTADDAAVPAGTDVVSLTLKNGWVFAGYHWEWDGGRGYIDDLQGFEVGSSDFVGKVPFILWKKGYVGYRFWLYVAGPAGVPYR